MTWSEGLFRSLLDQVLTVVWLAQSLISLSPETAFRFCRLRRAFDASPTHRDVRRTMRSGFARLPGLLKFTPVTLSQTGYDVKRYVG